MSDDPALAEAWSHHQAGDLDGAASRYRALIAKDPGRADVHDLLGLLALQQSRPALAVESLERASNLDPQVALYLHHLGAAHSALGQPDAAIASLRAALKLEPANATVHRDLGHALQKVSQWAEAVTSYRSAVGIDSADFDSLKGLAKVLLRQEKFTEAKVYFIQLLKEKPQDAGSWFNLGVVNYRLRDYPAAEACYRECVRLLPADVKSQFHLARILQLQGKLPEAAQAYENCLAKEPGFADAHYDLGRTRLAAGDFARGWPEFEWRLATPYADNRVFPLPRWRGESLDGDAILIHAEGGLGDTLQFLRFVPAVQALGGRVTLAVQRALMPILTSSKFHNLIHLDTPDVPECRWQVPLLSLPFVLGITPATMPALTPYLGAQPTLITHWRKRLSALVGLKIGIHWRGILRSVEDRRSIPLAAFAPLAKLKHVNLISLQKNGALDLQTERDSLQVVDFGDELDGQHGAFMDTAAIMKCLDLVISNDTSIVHVAGALGVPVWVAHPRVAEWRWMQDRDDTPWYPSMRLFRQTRDDNWGEVFQRMADELAKVRG